MQNPLLPELRAWRRAAKKLSRALSRTIEKDPACAVIRAEAMAHFNEVATRFPHLHPDDSTPNS